MATARNYKGRGCRAGETPVRNFLFGLSDTSISIADTSVPDNEVADSGANNYSASATITITMYTSSDEQASQLA